MSGYIDSRDLIAEVDTFDAAAAELRDEIADEDTTPERRAEARVELAELIEEDGARVEAIRELGDEVGGDWSYGATLIPDDEFETYAQELADDLGLFPSDDAWPARCIDWTQAANELRADYTSVTFDGIDYLVRA